MRSVMIAKLISSAILLTTAVVIVIREYRMWGRIPWTQIGYSAVIILYHLMVCLIF